ncbi:putative Annexin A4 [Hypsibius exemplaris]|uniref:Annexin A4 n=1 Tax=Hypsibius exemplaris TaxID=2072580 RepID=A0A1W0WTK4_HYPEX|nr:putative Annexin A4 [Hypsibius exemplaris]
MPTGPGSEPDTNMPTIYGVATNSASNRRDQKEGYLRPDLLKDLKSNERHALGGLSRSAGSVGDRTEEVGPGRSILIPIFTGGSHAHLRHVFDEYKKICGVDIEKDITNEMTGDVADFFLTIIKLSRNPPAYFAERLYRAMKGIGTNEKEVVRVIVSRSEKDLGAVKTEFAKLYGKSLESFISGDFSGDAKKNPACHDRRKPAK